MSVALRNAMPEDAAAVAKVQLEGWRSAYRDIFPPEVLAAVDEAALVEQYRARLAPGEGRFAYVAATGPEVIGALAGGPPRDPHIAGDAEVYSLYVVSWGRGRGVGEALMSAAFAGLAPAGRRRVGLWSLSAAEGAQRFYRRLGGMAAAQAERPFLGGRKYASTLYRWDDAGAAVACWAQRRSAVAAGAAA